MNQYDPLEAPDPQEWKALSEDEQMNLVRAYHEREDELPPDANEVAHTLCHVTVENQVALGDETPVADALDRLVHEGLDRHQAIHALAGVLMEHLWKSQQASEDAQAGEESTLTEKYYEGVKNLTAQQWLDQAPRL